MDRQHPQAGELEQPLFILHGENDSTFSIEQSQSLYEAAAGPKRFWKIPDANHGLSEGTVETVGNDIYFERLADFLGELAPTCL